MTAADPRKFRYPIEAIRQRQIWQRDILQGRLALINRESLAAREQLEVLRDVLAQQVMQASSCWRKNPDPRAHENMLAYLANSQALIEKASQDLNEIKARQAKARQACEECQRKLELTESHRQSCLRQHITKEQQMLAAEADGQWTMRQLWLGNKVGGV